MKYKKEELENLIFEKKLSYREIGGLYGVSDTYIKKISNKLGISLNVRRKVSENFVPHNKNKKRIMVCVNCGKEYEHYNMKFCNKICESEYTIKKKYEDFLNNNEKYCKAAYSRFLSKNTF